ncbi:50S ribosomal protein L25 [Candidatus Ishikawella capsulata]|uniref:Large ribosomal subunit protein bL25 n=1 Tax=Candidatus Ishikawaella capsulata Mpkobe TaxID=476281 RepID=C5WDL8_9ENTR|nr:50S ribosomal protein L25 [Candidatus Ishikawaella capsulata]BAH83424.1 50S ribosomal protein L25 [Candidatus Ishikawaella capsulata Mpkobe]
MFTINAMKRTSKGKGSNRRLRASNKFPAVIYGGKESAIPITLEQETLINIQKNIDFYREILKLVVDNQEIKVKVQAVQRHPFKPKFYHIDFIRI